jgi:Domain of unknown function (DUF927)
VTTIGGADAGVNEPTSPIYKEALAAHAAGISVIPPSEDGEKRPWPNNRGAWNDYKNRRPTHAELKTWYGGNSGRSGIGFVAGPASGDVEPWDFDERETYQRFKEEARKLGLSDLIARIERGYCDDTAGGGVRWLVRRPDGIVKAAGRDALARRPKRPQEKRHEKDDVKALIERPDYAILAPTNGRVHPSGKPYVRRSGGFATIASYTAEERQALTDLARSFDQMPREDAAPPPGKGKRGDGNRPGDDYNASTTWEELLPRYGWQRMFTRGNGTTYWRRPGKEGGSQSATTNYCGCDKLYVFSTSCGLDPDKAYSRFAFYVVMDHGGDFSKAAAELARQGYGAKQRTSRDADTSPCGDEDRTVYRFTPSGCIQWRRRTTDTDAWMELTNFTARIKSDIIQDDGVETTRALEIEASIAGRMQTFTIPAAQFAPMNWPLEHLGAEAAVHPGQGAKDRARHAVQVLSKNILQRRVFTHTGWRKVDGQWVYMHGGGAIGPLGPLGRVEVQLPEQLERFEFPNGADHQLRDDVDATHAVLNVAPHRVTVPLLGAPFRAVLGEADFGLHLSGPTGVKKTELAALSQQHFGPEMNSRALPCSWSSTGNALEAIASAAKDAVLVIDDFVPQGTTADRARLNALADRVLRAQGNRSGRARLRSDATLRRARPPRGLMISTGEEVPAGQSLRARIIILDVQPGDVNVEELTKAQHDAACGAYARVLAAFIRWLAPQLEQVRTDFKSLTHKYRNNLPQIHPRTADAIAQLAAAWSIWLRFVVHVGAGSCDEVSAIEGSVWKTLSGLAAEQAALQRASDPVDRFRELLVAALASGKAHVASATLSGGRPPEKPDAWGWRKDGMQWHPRGDCIGWCDEHGLYLEPDASYGVVQKMGDGIGIAVDTLHRRMAERGVLLSTERRGDRRHLKVRKTIGGVRRQVLHVHHDLRPSIGKGGPSGPSDPGREISEQTEDLA